MTTKFVGFRARTDWFDQLDEIAWRCRTTRSSFIRQSIDHYIEFLKNGEDVPDLLPNNDNDGGYPHAN